MSEAKPTFRKAEAITEEEGDKAIESGDPERMRYALIDGSRCLDDSWALGHAWELVSHENPNVRWAALFAIDQTRFTWVPTLVEDFEPIHILDRIISNDLEKSVRGMAATTMTDVISLLVSTQRQK
jgi:beta-mannanase